MSDNEARFDPTDRSEYDLVRAANVIVPLSPIRKARICGVLTFFGALAAPLVTTLPVPIREASFSGPPSEAPLSVAVLMLVGVVAAGGAGLGLVALQWRLSRGPRPTGDDVWEFLAVEDALTGIGFVSGSLSLGIGVPLLASGHWGIEVLGGLRDIGVEPYLSVSALPITPRLTTAVALTLGLAILVATVVVDRE